MAEVQSPPAAPTKTERRRARSRIVLSLAEARRIRIRLTGTVNGQASAVGYVCSESWARECLAALESGRVQPRKDRMAKLEADMYKAGIYPPGGAESRMMENPRTLRYMPPDYNGSPLDEREDSMTLAESCRFPSSPSAAVIEHIRLTGAKPLGGRFRESHS